MTRLEEITTQMHVIEDRLKFLNHKYGYDTGKMQLYERMEYDHLKIKWDDLKLKRDNIKATANRTTKE